MMLLRKILDIILSNMAECWPKGRLLGLQFRNSFSDDLYYNISAHAIKMAIEIREVLRKRSAIFI